MAGRGNSGGRAGSSHQRAVAKAGEKKAANTSTLAPKAAVYGLTPKANRPGEESKSLTAIKSQPITRLPWYQSTLLWGATSLAATIVLTVVAAMKKDLRWVLLFAWPLACVAAWEFVSYFTDSRKKQIAWTGSTAVASALSLLALTLWLKPAGDLQAPVAAPPAKKPETEPVKPAPDDRRFGESHAKRIPYLTAKEGDTKWMSEELLTDKQKAAIVNNIAKGYKNIHGVYPTYAYINKLLAQKKFDFTAAPARRSGAQFIFRGGSFHDNGTAILNEDDNAKYEFENTEIHDNKRGIVNVPQNPK